MVSSAGGYGRDTLNHAQTTLIHAAELLEAQAYWLLDRNNLLPDRPKWYGAMKEKIAHDDALTTALELRLLAKRINDGQVAVSPELTLTKGDLS